MFTLLCLLFSPVLARDYNNTDTYIAYYPGDPGSKIIICAPHGGSLIPAIIPDRHSGCYNTTTDECLYTDNTCAEDAVNCKVVTSKDLYTREMAQVLDGELETLTGYKPHLIVNNLKRPKLDPNREIGEGAQGNADMVAAWEEYHGHVQTAYDAVNGTGILFDIHGQGHSDKWVEIGYTISKSKLNAGTILANESSIYALSQRVDIPFASLLYGNKSLGALIQSQGVKCVPSPEHPRPNSSSPGGYYSGGYTTKRWGSQDGGIIDAIQLENHKDLRSKCKEECGELSKAIAEFANRHYYKVSGGVRVVVSVVWGVVLVLLLG